MLNTNEILETLRMIDEEKLDVRTITMGISLFSCVSDDTRRLCDNIYDRITRKAERLVKVGEDIENMKFNTAIAAMMTLVNDFFAKGQVTRGELRTLLLLLNPVAPHITEEMWENQGFGAPIHHQPWPKWDEEKMKTAEVEIAVQICGKVRGRIMIPADMTREQAEQELIQREDVQALLGGKTVMKVIFVPGRLLNIVAK